MEPTPLFDRLDTIILRVRDLERACAWYAATLGLRAAFEDPAEGLAVLPVGDTTSLTLWQLKPGETMPAPDAAGAFPIFAATDAAAARQVVLQRGARVDELVDGPGVRFFSFWDVDGNRLEACQVLEAAAPAAGA